MADLKARIAAMLMQRRSYSDIARELEVDPQTVANYRATILAEWRESSAADADELFTTIFNEYATIKNEALTAWERSKLPKETKTIKDGLEGTEETNRTEGQCGDASFLTVAAKALESMRALKGLDAPKKTELTGANGEALIPGTDSVPVRVTAVLLDARRLELELQADEANLP